MSSKEWTVHIRVFRDGDEEQARRLVRAATMSTLYKSFQAAIFRESTIHLIVIITAVMFVYVGSSPPMCLLSVPLALATEFLLILLAHLWKAHVLDRDMLSVKEVYMSSDLTRFYVAEAIAPEGTKVPQNEDKVTIAKADDWRQVEGLKGVRHLIGTVAIVGNKTDLSAAWMRRMAVQAEWQRRGIASALVDQALIFCQRKGFQSIELVTTECHNAARALYRKKGFELRQLYHKQILSNIIQILMYEFTFIFPKLV